MVYSILTLTASNVSPFISLILGLLFELLRRNQRLGFHYLHTHYTKSEGIYVTFASEVESRHTFLRWFEDDYKLNVNLRDIGLYKLL